jgi:pilus assembly protein Flp/PilA
MNQFIQSFADSIRSFAKDEDGAQVIEYALIIAVVSIALILLLKGLTDTGGGFTSFITKVTNCLTNSCAAAAP